MADEETIPLASKATQSTQMTQNEPNSTTKSSMPYGVGKWLPSDKEILERWVNKLVSGIEAENRQGVDFEDELAAYDEGRDIPGLHPTVQEFKDLIETDPKISMFIHQMFDQIPLKEPYLNDASGKPQVRNYRVMLQCINKIISAAPEYSRGFYVGSPLCALLNWPSVSLGGHAFLLDDKVNKQFKKILNAWAEYLGSPESCSVLNTDPHTGWFGADAMEDMKGFADDFICDPTKPHHGFTSWDNFFTRQFREGRRPIASPDDNKIIVNACESATYNIQFNVRRRSRFWIKSQPYSMLFMLANDPLAERFVGGTVYQAFLSALSYHRWHSPVDGVIKKAYVVDGSYFVVAPWVHPLEKDWSLTQGYFTGVNARALIFIEADNKYIGLMAFVGVGIGEISSTDITVSEGQHVTKGQEIGMFHYGGSTYCLVFRPGVDVKFVVEQKEIGGYSNENILVNSKIASVPFS